MGGEGGLQAAFFHGMHVTRIIEIGEFHKTSHNADLSTTVNEKLFLDTFSSQDENRVYNAFNTNLIATKRQDSITFNHV